MARKPVHVRHHEGLPLRRRRAANPLSDGDAHAGGFALERAQQQLPAIQAVNAGPVDVRQSVPEQRREVGGVGNGIALAFEQGAGLLQQLRVARRLVGGGCGFEGDHAAASIGQSALAAYHAGGGLAAVEPLAGSAL